MVKKTSDVKHLNFLGWLGTSSEPEITAQAIEVREPKGNKEFTGILGDCTKFAESSGMLFLIIQN